MKSAFFASLTGLLVAGILATTMTGPGPWAGNGTVTQAESARVETQKPFRSFAEFALEMMMRQGNNCFLDAYVDPGDYIVGPGDGFTVFFVSGNIGNIQCEINTSGGLFIKSVGLLSIDHCTLADAITRINDAVGKNYAGSEFTVQLTTFRFIKVNIIGAVTDPGIYYVPAIWRVSEALDLAGGLSPLASDRTILLRGEDGDTPVDLMRFGTVGDLRANPFICGGNTIIVPYRSVADQYRSISGLINQPGMFLAVESDCLGDLIAFAGGPRGKLADMEIVISGADGSERRLDGASPDMLSHQLAPGENVILAWKSGRESFGNVIIAGAVARPGRYLVSQERFSVDDLLSVCGGMTRDGYREMIQIYRWYQGNFIPEPVSTSAQTGSEDASSQESDGEAPGRYQRLSNNPRESRDWSQLLLVDGDSVFVPTITGTVSVRGAVAAPGLIRFAKGENAEYYVRQAGGLGFDADPARMVVINPMTGSQISAAGAGELYDGEVLFVPRKESGAKP
jgi:polysaccharide export outer membrane protein